MFSFLEISDGTLANSCELTDDRNYALVSFSPVVTPLRDSVLGMHGPWAEVQEQITFHALGNTAAEAYRAAAKVNALLDNARKWYDRSSITPIRLRVLAQDSALATPLEAPIFGRAVGGPPNLGLPAVWSQTYGKYVIQNITIVFRRGGPFLTAASESAAGASTANPGVMAVTLPSTPALAGPCVVRLDGFAITAGRAIDIPDGLLLMAPSLSAATDSGLVLFQGESPTTQTLAAGATFAATADAAARASAGNVGRLNHAAAVVNVESRLYYSLASWGNARRMAVYCTVRNNSASVWTIRAENVLNDLALSTPGTPSTTIPAGPSNPQVVFLGEIDMDDGSQGFNLFAAATLISGAGTLDIDTLVCVDLTSDQAMIVSVGGYRTTLITATPSSSIDLRAEAQPLSRVDPRLRWVNNGSNTFPTAYSGAPAPWASGSIIKLIWYATHLVGGVTPYWTTQNAAGAAILSLTPTISRQTTYLLPE